MVLVEEKALAVAQYKHLAAVLMQWQCQGLLASLSPSLAKAQE